MRWFRNFSQKNRSTGNCADDMLTIPISVKKKNAPTPRRDLFCMSAEAFFFIFYFVRSIMISLLLCTNAVISSGFSGLCARIARSYNCLQMIGTLLLLLCSTTNCTSGWFASVSYTHLDVYKRQCLFSTLSASIHVTESPSSRFTCAIIRL